MKKRYYIIIGLILLSFIFLFMKIDFSFSGDKKIKYKNGFFGVTFSRKFSQELGLDWKEVYLAMLDDLNVKEIRLPIYWDDIEMREGVYNFSEYDYMINEGEKRNVHFIINVGQRLPRWPECHTPKWAQENDVETNHKLILDMLSRVVNRYKDNNSVKYWQIENEPLLDVFGECPHSDYDFLKQEIALVRSLDSRPVIVTASGELSNWKKEAQVADIFGSTLYRIVWGPATGYIKYPIPAWFYRFKANRAHIANNKRFIIELQAEPWVAKGAMVDMTDKEIKRSFSINRFRENINYATKVNFEKTYLWGVEWWYWQYKYGNKEYWKLARTLFK